MSKEKERFEKAFQQAVKDCYQITRKLGFSTTYLKCNQYVWDDLHKRANFDHMTSVLAAFDKLSDVDQVHYILARPTLLEARK